MKMIEYSIENLEEKEKHVFSYLENEGGEDFYNNDNIIKNLEEKNIDYNAHSVIYQHLIYQHQVQHLYYLYHNQK